MKSATLSTEAWHFRLANYGTRRISSYDLRDGLDFCTYSKLVIAGLFTMLMRITLVVVCVMGFGYSVYDIFRYVLTGDSLAPGTLMVLAVLAAIFLAVIIIGIVERLKLIADRRRSKAYADKFERGIEPKQGFITLAYRKFKEKTCFMIKFEDHE